MEEGVLLGIKKEAPVILITQEISRVLGAVSGTRGKDQIYVSHCTTDCLPFSLYCVTVVGTTELSLHCLDYLRNVNFLTLR